MKIFKKTAGFSLFFLLALGLFLNGQEKFKIGGYTYTYTVDGKNVTIIDYNENAKNITIPSKIQGCSVTSIGDRAFFHSTNLTSIVIPDSVVTIGDKAFWLCPKLTKIIISNSVTSIGDEAFRLCPSLTLVVDRESFAEQYAIDNDIPYKY